MTTRITPRQSKLALLLHEAAEHGFDHVIIDTRDLGEIGGIGFVDAKGGRHAVRVDPWEDLGLFVRRY